MFGTLSEVFMYHGAFNLTEQPTSSHETRKNAFQDSLKDSGNSQR